MRFFNCFTLPAAVCALQVQSEMFDDARVNDVAVKLLPADAKQALHEENKKAIVKQYATDITRFADELLQDKLIFEEAAVVLIKMKMYSFRSKANDDTAQSVAELMKKELTPIKHKEHYAKHLVENLKWLQESQPWDAKDILFTKHIEAHMGMCDLEFTSDVDGQLAVLHELFQFLHENTPWVFKKMGFSK